MNAVPVDSIAPIEHREAAQLAATEYGRLLDCLRGVEVEDWRAPTDCPGWDVHAVVSHVLGFAEGHASLRELVHQQRAPIGDAATKLDATTALQVRERAHLSPAELMARLERVAPRSVRARRRLPAPVRAVKIKVVTPWGVERWTLGYLNDVIFTRDAWMHRVDVCRATGREMTLTADHDGRIVADAVAEWFRRHGKPCALVLDGPAGATFVSSGGGDEVRLDAVEFCRVLSGRGVGEGLMKQEVPF